MVEEIPFLEEMTILRLNEFEKDEKERIGPESSKVVLEANV